MGNVFRFRRPGPWDRPARPPIGWRYRRRSGWRNYFGWVGRKLAPVFALSVVLLGMAAYDRWAGDLYGYFSPTGR